MDRSEQTDGTTGRPKVSARAIAVLAFVAVCVYAFDQITKALVIRHLVYGQLVTVLGPLLRFQYVRNPGAAFSFATGQTWVFTIVAVIVVGVIVVLARRIRSLWWVIVFGMLLGGTLGNLTDRLVRAPGFGRGEVIDFVSTPWIMPGAIYNVADSFICISMVILVLLVVFGVNLDGSRTPSRRAERAASAEAVAAPGAGSVAPDNQVSGAAGTDTSANVATAGRPPGEEHGSLGHDAT